MVGPCKFPPYIFREKLYIDPYLGEYVEKADIVLVTHGHSDHCDVGKIEMIRKPETIIMTSNDCSSRLSGEIVLMSPGDRKGVYGFSIIAVESYNIKRFRALGVPYHPKNTQVGLCARVLINISLPNQVFYCHAIS